MVETVINAPIERCFNLSLSVDLHQESTKQSSEKAVAGKLKGILGIGEQVTWRAKHFGVWQEFTSKIVEFKYPDYFSDEMQKGAFKKFRHEHYFDYDGKKVHMKDIVIFESPLWVLGKIFNELILKDYLKKFLIKRNEVIRYYAETEKWKEVIGLGQWGLNYIENEK